MLALTGAAGEEFTPRSTRYVKALMFRGLPLKITDPVTREQDMVTLFFELGLEQSRIVPHQS